MISEQDNEQDQRIAKVEAEQTALGRSIDQVRDLTIRTGDEIKADFHSHEDTCKENWRQQRESNVKSAQQLKLILWVLGVVGAAVITVAVENFWTKIWGA